MFEWKRHQNIIGIVGVRVQFGPFGTAATNRSIVPAPGDYDDGKIDGMVNKGNRSTLRKPTQMPLCQPQTPHDAQTRTRAAAVGSQRLTAWATARPMTLKYVGIELFRRREMRQRAKRYPRFKSSYKSLVYVIQNVYMWAISAAILSRSDPDHI
jgi:hypothetical protein